MENGGNPGTDLKLTHNSKFKIFNFVFLNFRPTFKSVPGSPICHYIHTPIFTIWQVKIYKAKSIFILKTTFWKLPCSTKTVVKSAVKSSLLIFFGLCSEMHFVSLFFLKKRNITRSLLMKHLKCTVVHYVNLNPSSINTLFSSSRPLNMQLFFKLLFMFILMRFFLKALSKKYIF